MKKSESKYKAGRKIESIADFSTCESVYYKWHNGKQWDSLFATENDVTHWIPLPEPPKEETDG